VGDALSLISASVQSTVAPMRDYSLDEVLQLSRGDAARWPGRGAANRLEPECWPVIRPSFSLSRTDSIFTIGSCFARNVERHLDESGFDVPAMRLARELKAEESLNKYTPPSIHQELSWAKAIFDRDDVVAEADLAAMTYEEPGGGLVDLQRHGAPGPGVSVDQALAVRRLRYALLRPAFTCPVAVITLGLIECWWDTTSGAAVELQPALFRANGERFRFRRLTFAEALEHTSKTIDLLLSGATRRILLTTSPVPLLRTFTADDVIVANTYSKSVLRSVCGQMAEERAEVDYFPSYESVMLTRQPEVWLNDLIHVAPAFVGRIMGRVVEEYAGVTHEPATDDVLALNALVADAQWERAAEVLRRIGDATPAAGRARHRFLVDAAETLVATGQAEAARERVAGVPSPLVSDLDGNDLLRLAKVLEALGQHGRARRTRAAGLDLPSSVDMFKVRAHYLILAKREDDARLVVDAGVERFSDTVEGLVAIGGLYTQLRDPDRARRSYDAAAMLAAKDAGEPIGPTADV
jgi:GSCFA family protein